LCQLLTWGVAKAKMLHPQGADCSVVNEGSNLFFSTHLQSCRRIKSAHL
jgi:hypothetical protein